MHLLVGSIALMFPHYMDLSRGHATSHASLSRGPNLVKNSTDFPFLLTLQVFTIPLLLTPVSLISFSLLGNEIIRQSQKQKFCYRINDTFTTKDYNLDFG